MIDEPAAVSLGVFGANERLWGSRVSGNYFDARAMTVLIRGAGNATTVVNKVRDTIRAMDNTVPLYNVSTMSEHVNFALLPAKGGAIALNFVGMVALTLMALGLYGTIAHMVSRRRFEIGLRRALGAQDGDVIVLVVTQAMRLVLAGVVVGISFGLAGSRLLGSLLYSVESADPVVFGLAPVVLALVSVLATWVPAYQAVRIDPARALRPNEQLPHESLQQISLLAQVALPLQSGSRPGQPRLRGLGCIGDVL